jgi:Peptidase family M50
VRRRPFRVNRVESDVRCHYWRVFVRVVYQAGRMLAGIVVFAVILVLVISALVQAQGSPFLDSVWMAALVVVGMPVGVVVHEAGHLLACLAFRVQVRGVQIGNGKSPRLRFTVRGVEVSLGLPYSGLVRYTDPVSAVRRAIITAAGSLANLIAAAALFTVGPRGILAVTAALFSAGHAGTLCLLGIALLMTLIGVINLLPFRERNGRPTDGARLLGLFGGSFARAVRPSDAKVPVPLATTPAAPNAKSKLVLHQQGRPLPPEQAAKWLTAYWQREPLALHAVGFVGRSLRLRGLITELLELHADLPQPVGPHARKLTVAAHMLDWEVLMVPGLPANALDRAVNRVQWVLRTAEFEPRAKLWSREAVLHTLALGKLRQGHFAEAEELCQPILALPDLGAGSRATVLATVVLARRALGLPYGEELTEARSLGPGADLVAEATEPAGAKAPDPGTTGTRQFQGA